MRALVRRGTFLAGGLAAVTIAGSCAPVAAAGARSGDWCSRTRGKPFTFNLYKLDPEGTREADGGEIFSLDSLTGSPVWMVFLTSWCPPCNDEAANMVSMASAYRDRGVAVIGIDVKEKAAPVRAYIKRNKINFPIAMDSTGSVFDELGGMVYPTHVFLDSRGAITCVTPHMLTRSQMDNEIAVAIAASTR